MSYFSEIKSSLETIYNTSLDDLSIYEYHTIIWGYGAPSIMNMVGTTTHQNLTAVKIEYSLLKQGLIDYTDLEEDTEVTISGTVVKLKDATLKQLPNFINIIKSTDPELSPSNTNLTVHQYTFCKYNYLYVKLTDENGNPLSNVNLNLIDVAQDPYNFTYTTDNNGIISHQMKREGNWSISIVCFDFVKNGRQYNRTSIRPEITVTDFETSTYTATSCDNVNSSGSISYTGTTYRAWSTKNPTGESICGTNSSPINASGSYIRPRPFKYDNLTKQTGYEIPTDSTIYSIKVDFTDGLLAKNTNDIVFDTPAVFSNTQYQCRLLNIVNGSNSGPQSDNIPPQWCFSQNHSHTWYNSEFNENESGDTRTYITMNTSSIKNNNFGARMWFGTNSGNACRLKLSNVLFTITYKPAQNPMT